MVDFVFKKTSHISLLPSLKCVRTLKPLLTHTHTRTHAHAHAHAHAHTHMPFLPATAIVFCFLTPIPHGVRRLPSVDLLSGEHSNVQTLAGIVWSMTARYNHRAAVSDD